MRICILAKHIPPKISDGIAKNRWLYAKMFQKYGWEVHLITNGISGVEEFRDGIYIHEISPEEYNIKEKVINQLVSDESVRHMLTYSYAVYKRVKKLNEQFPVDLIDQSLWGLEGLMTKIKLPGIPMLTRLDTTTRLIQEINYPGEENEFTVQNQLEQYMLTHSDSYVFNSWSILKETERLYETNFLGKPYAVIHHGIELHHHEAQARPLKKDKFKVLIPGRLEKRKGTNVLVKWVLPKLMSELKNIEIHFVGKDHAEWDGFKEENGLTYTEYINFHYRKEISKSIFLHGYVEEENLIEHYENADCVLVPSLYESLGLVYLEAANYEKPLIAFNTGALPELFEHTKEALLAPVDAPLQLCSYIRQLQDDATLRERLAKNSRQKLEQKFSAAVMTERCVSFIQSILTNNQFGTVYQLINALTVGDGVGGFTRDYDYLFKTNGQLTQIMGNHSSESLRHLTDQIHEFNFGFEDTIVYQYCGHCEWVEYINTIDQPAKVLLFHNITPPHFFKETSSEYLSSVNGFKQVHMLDNFDLYVALSQYSLNILQQLIPHKLNVFIVPQLIDRDLILERPYTKELVEKLRKKYSFHIIFVGRVVPHKKQIDIIRFAQFYSQNFNSNFHISIIGGGTESYLEELRGIVRKHKLSDNITLTGKISDADLYAYYRSADIYISMSEHEGFGTPLAESMVFEVPVVAYGVTAIPETVGDNGCIFYEKDFEVISGIVNRLVTDKAFRADVVEKQNEQLKKYSKESVRKSLREMQSKCRALHAERINNLMNEGRLYHEEFINFKDPRFIKRGEWKVADGRTLIHYGHDQQSSLEIDVEFIEADIFIVNNNHSGKVAVFIDNKEVLRIDLYNQQWIVKQYTVAGLTGFNVHSIKIIPLCEKNSRSTGKEALVYGVRVKRKFKQAARALYKDSTPVSLAGELLLKKTESVHSLESKS